MTSRHRFIPVTEMFLRQIQRALRATGIAECHEIADEIDNTIKENGV